MTTDAQKTELLNDFQKYLEQSDLEPLSTQEHPGMHALLSELTGLKTEVKAESRQFKNTLDTLGSALTSVQDDNKALSAELARYAQRMEQQHDEILRTMLLEVIDIVDRLNVGNDVLKKYRPVKSLFKNSRKKDVLFIKHFTQGQSMTIKRFDQLLQRYHVRPVDCVGLLLDPVTMQAVETSCIAEFKNGMVLEELRKGFLFKDQVLRLAEVRVNKIT